MYLFLSSVRCEQLKCKGTLIWPAFLLIPLIPILLGTGNYLGNLEILSAEWYSLWTQVSLFYATFFFPPLIGAYCAFLWRYENFNHNRNTLFSRPVSYAMIYLSKLSMVLLLTVLTQLWFALLFLGAGIISGLSLPFPSQLLFWIGRALPGAFVIASLQFLIASFIQNFALPIALGLFGGVTGLLAANMKAGFLWPYSQMLLGMNSNQSEDLLAGRQELFFLSCFLYLILFILAGIALIQFRKEG